MTINPSQNLVNLMGQIKAQNGNEKANIVNDSEKQQILDAVKNMQSSGMTEEQIDANLKFIQSELQVTNISANYEIKGENNINKTGATTFKFDMKPKETNDIKGFCKDYQPIASEDAKNGKDPQFKALFKNEKNFLIVDQNTGDIKGFYDKDTDGGKTKVNKNDKGVTTSVVGNGNKLPEGMPTNIKDVIKEDFGRYGANLVSKFPNNEEGAKKFLEALSTIPGNNGNKNISLDNAKELLSYIHTGANTEGKANVQQLQCLLRGMTGDKGIDISNKNNPVGGDNAYGYATTLQVRSLDAFINKNCEPASLEITVSDKPPLLKGNPIFLIDRSGSMQSETSSLSKTLGKFLEDGGNYRVATYQDNSSKTGDLRLVNNGQTMDSKKTLEQLSNKQNFSNTQNVGNQESGIKNTSQLLNSGKIPDNTGNPTENIIMFTDELDTLVSGAVGPGTLKVAEDNFDKMINAAKDKNYKPVVIFNAGSDSAPKYIAVDLSTLKDKLAEKGKKFSDVCSTYEGNTALDFNKINSILNLKSETQMEKLTF